MNKWNGIHKCVEWTDGQTDRPIINGGSIPKTGGGNVAKSKALCGLLCRPFLFPIGGNEENMR